MKLYYEAIRALPEEWITEETRITDQLVKDAVVAVNPKLKPLIYTKEEGWIIIPPDGFRI